MGEIEKAHFYLSPSRIDFTGRADWTCQVDTLWDKNTHKYLKLNPPRWMSIFCQGGLNRAQKLHSQNLIRNPNWGT